MSAPTETSLPETRRARVNGIELAYDVRGEGEPLLLIMGLGAQLVHWPDGFCDALAARGFRVIRFDNRDAGESTWLKHLPTPRMRPVMAAVFLGRRFDAPYSLGDMAEDTVGLLDALEIESAHVLGASMGGMIAQTLAARHGERVRTLTSLMSGVGGPRSLVGHPKAIASLLKPVPRDASALDQYYLDSFRAIGSPGALFDEPVTRCIIRQLRARGENPRGFMRQFAAVAGGGNRSGELATIRVPTLVLHGSSDPLLLPRNAELTRRAIPGARKIIIEGMGHDLPPGRWKHLVDAVADHALG